MENLSVFLYVWSVLCHLGPQTPWRPFDPDHLCCDLPSKLTLPSNKWRLIPHHLMLAWRHRPHPLLNLILPLALFFFVLWEGGHEAHRLHFTGSLSCIDFDGFSLCNRGHLVQWLSAGNYYRPKWGLPILKLHFSCNLGAFTLFLQSVTPPQTPGAALKQPPETADLQDHLPLRW